MSVIDSIIEKAKAGAAKLVFPEGQDSRVVEAANKVIEDGIAEVVVLGTETEISAACAEVGITERKFDVIDPATSDLVAGFAEEFTEMRKAKGMTLEKATETMKNRLYFANMMCRKELVGGLVAGSIASTGDMLRASFQVIGTAPGIKTGSSCMMMDLVTPSPAGDDVLLMADCAVNPDPDAAMLVDIALATAQTYRSLTGNQPKVAFLAFSTGGSATHPALEKIVEAAAITKKRVEDEGLDMIVDGEIQADAAIVPSVAASKCPDSPLKGAANVLIFPDLNSGNIGHKLVQRLSGCGVYGPVLQGLAKPVNDLSRGCSAGDIYGVAAITACQALG